MGNTSKGRSKSLNRLDEYYLLPVLLSCALVSSICLVFFLNELIKPQFEIERYYQWDSLTYSAYRKQLLIYITATFLLLVLQGYALRLKKRWGYLLLIGLNVVLFVLLPRVLEFQPEV